MKISQMLVREDFYAINDRTLQKYYADISGQTDLFVYPQLNAIITKKPSSAVKKYLFNEYGIRANPCKRLLVNGYVFACLHMRGLLADKRISVMAKVDKDTLIYPCNKKYRVFHFDENVVDVIAKSGFDDTDLQREISFRTKESLPAFVPALMNYDTDGYRERIIEGLPLARIQEGFDAYRDEAYRLLSAYAQLQSREVPCNEYICSLKEQIAQHAASSKVRNGERLRSVVERLVKACEPIGDIPLCFSHGDLQAGNIWIERETHKIFIIDWESWGERSIWYDRATLYQGLRPGKIERFLNCDMPKTHKAVILLEDLIFRLKELTGLPLDFGTEQYEEYVREVAKWLDIT
ncbi:MAG: phosphotransferase [Clostridia bacterium]|nr:phosphotransferase [Clostridia bacterium]